MILPEPGEPEHDFLVASLDGATGAERWRLVRNGTPGPPDPDDADWDDTSDEATALALAPGGDVIACGYLRNVETGADWTVVRLAGDTGVERWRHVVDGAAHGSDLAEAVALDASGDLLVAGTLQAAAESWQVVVTRLDGASGIEGWRRLPTGSTPG